MAFFKHFDVYAIPHAHVHVYSATCILCLVPEGSPSCYNYALQKSFEPSSPAVWWVAAWKPLPLTLLDWTTVVQTTAHVVNYYREIDEVDLCELSCYSLEDKATRLVYVQHLEGIYFNFSKRGWARFQGYNLVLATCTYGQMYDIVCVHYGIKVKLNMYSHLFGTQLLHCDIQHIQNVNQSVMYYIHLLYDHYRICNLIGP